jgi:hypothetical protein
LANFYVTHHEYPDNPKLFTINIGLVVKRTGEPGTIFSYGKRGEQFWEIYIASSGKDLNGDDVPPFWADIITTEENIDELVAKKIKDLCNAIDWTQGGEYIAGLGSREPYVEYQYPANNQVDVPIVSTIKLTLKEPLPGSGMNISSMYMKVNGVSISPSVYGHPYKYERSFSPKPIFGS